AVPKIDIALPSRGLALAVPSGASSLVATRDDTAAFGGDGAALDAPAGSTGGGIALVDVSTAVSQFGVAFGGMPERVTTTSIADLLLQTQGRDLYVMTLPAVQWEPVSTPGDPSFPSPLSFDDCGNATSLVADTVELVPIAPRPAIDALVDRYN